MMDCQCGCDSGSVFYCILLGVDLYHLKHESFTIYQLMGY